MNRRYIVREEWVVSGIKHIKIELAAKQVMLQRHIEVGGVQSHACVHKVRHTTVGHLEQLVHIGSGARHCKLVLLGSNDHQLFGPEKVAIRLDECVLVLGWI